jgi:hypothetical protein
MTVIPAALTRHSRHLSRHSRFRGNPLRQTLRTSDQKRSTGLRVTFSCCVVDAAGTKRAASMWPTRSSIEHGHGTISTPSSPRILSLQLGRDFHVFRSLLPCSKYRLAGRESRAVCQVAFFLGTLCGHLAYATRKGQGFPLRGSPFVLAPVQQSGPCMIPPPAGRNMPREAHNV